MAMSDSAENEGFDVEAQKSLLVDNQDQAAAAEGERSSNSSSVHAKRQWKRSILVIRYTLLFKSRAHHYAADFTSSSDYASICVSDDDDKDSGTAAVSDDSFGPSPPANIELQQIQRENVAEIVKKKNLQALGDFGGVRGVAEALNTDLENGRMISIPFPPPTSSCKCNYFLSTFCTTFLESCNNFTVFLLFCAAVLSLGFGIKEDGLHRMGWFNGGVLLATVAMIVVCTTARKCWEKWSSNSKPQLGRTLDVQILRGGNTASVGEVDVEVGDIALLRTGGQLPADGLFLGTDDESLQLDDSSIINEANPFMFYGSKVVNGDGRMLVTSTGTDTVWGEMMSQAAHKDCNIECYLNKLFACLHILGLLISILIVGVLFLRYKAGKLDDERTYRPDSKGEPTQLKTVFEALKAIITGSKGTARVLTTLLSVSLLGIMEGIPLVISVSILVWNRKTLADMALELRDSFFCLNIQRLTTICTDISGGMTAHHLEIDLDAVERLKGEGIRIILASEEQVSVLTPIGERCGLLTTNSDDDLQVVTGEKFRELMTGDERLNMIEKICIMANCTPDDKFNLIKCLKERGQVVALVAQRTVDVPALKLADIGLTYGSSTSEIARDCSDITVADGECCFGFLLNVLESGRCFLENIRKFIQLQLIFIISSSLINFIATVALGDAPITAVQLFWLNLVVALVGGLALLTEPPVTELSTAEMPLEKLITRDMWRNIGVQVCYQTGVFVALQHKEQDFLGTTGVGVKVIIYNGFFLCQMFNLFIARKPTKKNIFSGVFHVNCSWFWLALLLFTICQAAFAAAEEFLGSTPRLDFKLWGVCSLIAFVSWPLDLLAKMLSDLPHLLSM